MTDKTVAVKVIEGAEGVGFLTPLLIIVLLILLAYLFILVRKKAK